MAETCIKLGCPEVIRLSRQDECTGESVPGLTNGYVIRCTRNATLEKTLRDEVVSEFVADCGPVDRYRQPPQIETFTLSFETSTISPELEAGLTGETLITNGASNDGVAYLANQGCSVAAEKPRYVAEVFFQRRGACGAGGANYLRYVLMGLEFAPSEVDAEGQIRFMRYTAQSEPLPVGGLLTQDGTPTAGPFDDFPAGIVTSLGALDPDAPLHATWFADPIADPVAGLTLEAGACYTATVPEAA